MDYSELDSFTKSYIETAFWSSTCDIEDSNETDEFEGSNEGPMDEHYDWTDLADVTLRCIHDECEQFQQEMYQLPYVKVNGNVDFPDSAQLGHDFWLTRNRHGAGFWAGGYPAPLGQELTDLAHSYGECILYVGDDGKIYQS